MSTLNELLHQMLYNTVDETDYSFDTATGNGVDVTFPFAFVGYGKGYIREDDIHVFVRDTDEASGTYNQYTELTEDFQFPTENTITLVTVVPAPLDGEENILIRRVMPKDEIYADIQNDSIFRKQVLNNSFIQLLYTIHETLDGFISVTEGLEEAIEDLVNKFTNAVIVPEVESPSLAQRQYPELNTRTNSVFVWNLNAEIVAVPIEEFLGFVGGSTTTGKSGLLTTSPAAGQFEIDVGAGTGIQVNANDVQVHPTQLALIDNALPKSGIDGIHYGMKDGVQHIPDAIDVTYTSGLPSSPDDAFNVQDAIRINTILIAALTAGVRFRGLWDADLNVPDIDAESKRSGDFWQVNVKGFESLIDINGLPITSEWQVGEKALWISYTENSVLIEGWAKILVTTILPAGNITFIGTIFETHYPAPAPIQVQDALDFIWDKLKFADDHRQIVAGNPHGTTPAMIGAATAAQGALADSALQPADNISELTNDVGYITLLEVPAAPVVSVHGRTGVVVGIVADYAAFYATLAQGALADSAIQPLDNISELTNDVGFITEGLESGDNISELQNDVGYITEALQTGDNVSELVNDAGYITSSSLPVVPNVQAGETVVAGNAVTTVVLGIPYGTTPYAISCEFIDIFGVSAHAQVTARTGTGFTIHNHNGSQHTATWTTTPYTQ